MLFGRRGKPQAKLPLCLCFGSTAMAGLPLSQTCPHELHPLGLRTQFQAGSSWHMFSTKSSRTFVMYLPSGVSIIVQQVQWLRM